MSSHIALLATWIGFILFCGCEGTPTHSGQEQILRQEAREDSLELIAAYERQSKIKWSVSPQFETEAVSANASLDAADDPAIWLHPNDPTQSFIIGSNKKGGLHLYNLQGSELAYFPVGNINNVDVLYGFQLGKQMIDLIGGSNRSDQSIDLFHLSVSDTTLIDLADGILPVDSTRIDDIYGFCFYQSGLSGCSYVFINGKNGTVQQFELRATAQERIRTTLVRQIRLDSQVEGMVADDHYGYLYVGEEDGGIWKIGAEPEVGADKTRIQMSGEENPSISYDIEGLTLYTVGESGYLIASSQGNFSYAIFERTGENAYLGSFRISGAEGIDGVEETDGIQAISDSLGPDYPMGIFIAQDGFNFLGDEIDAQNFKGINWVEIQQLLTDD